MARVYFHSDVDQERSTPTEVTGSGGPYSYRGGTGNFIVFSADSLGGIGINLATAVLAYCDRDYGTLQEWFGNVNIGWAFPSVDYLNLPFYVFIRAGSNGASHESCPNTRLFIDAFDGTNINFVRSLVVAEMDEVFMYNLYKRWDCGASNGEGLSRVLANDIYRDVQPSNFVSAPHWLNEPGRPDWVAGTEPTDTNYVSIGCAVLFLNWLRFQLLFAWQQIIAAGAPTLAQVYTNLTGRTDGFQRFSGLLARHFPVGTPVTMTNDNPFPLPDHAHIPKQRGMGVRKKRKRPE